MARTRRQIASLRHGDLVNNAFENSLVRDYVGKSRYLQYAASKAMALAYTSKFESVTSQNLSNEAAESGQLTMLDWARSVGCNWDASVFLSGVQGGRVEILQHLLDNACPVPQGEEACTAAATQGDLLVLRWLHEHDFGWSEAVCAKASRNGYLPVLQWACENGCPCDYDEVFGEAARAGRINVLEWGLGLGIEYNELTCGAAAECGQLETILWLLGHNCPWDEMVAIRSILFGRSNVLRWAKANGCEYDVHWTSPAGMTYLHSSIISGFADITKVLIADGASVDQLVNGRKPLHLAVMYDRVDIAIDLINAGANVNDTQGKDGETPLLIASRLGYLDIAKLLVDRGANPELSNVTRISSLLAATKCNHIDVMRLLLESRANPNYCTDGGVCALMIAIDYCNIPQMELLDDWGAKLPEGGLAWFLARFNTTLPQLLQLKPKLPRALSRVVGMLCSQAGIGESAPVRTKNHGGT